MAIPEFRKRRPVRTAATHKKALEGIHTFSSIEGMLEEAVEDAANAKGWLNHTRCEVPACTKGFEHHCVLGQAIVIQAAISLAGSGHTHCKPSVVTKVHLLITGPSFNSDPCSYTSGQDSVHLPDTFRSSGLKDSIVEEMVYCVAPLASWKAPSLSSCPAQHCLSSSAASAICFSMACMHMRSMCSRLQPECATPVALRSVKNHLSVFYTSATENTAYLGLLLEGLAQLLFVELGLEALDQLGRCKCLTCHEVHLALLRVRLHTGRSVGQPITWLSWHKHPGRQTLMQLLEFAMILGSAYARAGAQQSALTQSHQ